MVDIYVHGIPVPVTITEGSFLQHREMNVNVTGHYNADDGILIRDELYPGGKVSTLIHEAVHAAFPAMSEDDVIAIERWLPSFIIDNGGSMDWAREILDAAQSEHDAPQDE